MLVLRALLFGAALTVVAGVCTETSRHEGLLYPHMANNGDTEFVPRLDDGKMALAITAQYRVFQHIYRNQVWVVSNGLLAMNETSIQGYYNPYYFFREGTVFIAPWYSDVDINMADPEASHIWFRETSDRALLKRFKKDMGDYFCTHGNEFKPTNLIIVTYQRVQSFCDHRYMSYYYYYNYYYYYYYWWKKRSADNTKVQKEGISEDRLKPEEERATSPTNTFQLVLATDNGRRTFAMFNYQSICWKHCWSYNRAGFNNGKGQTFEIDKIGSYYISDLSEASNVNKDGRFMFRIDAGNLRAPNCSKLYLEDY